MFIRLILKPGTFLWLVEYTGSIFQLSSIKANAKQYAMREDAEKDIADIMKNTHWQYNFEICSY